jgi:hypothetical protein
MIVGRQRIIARKKSRRNAEHLDFAFPFAGGFAMIRKDDSQY